MGSYQRKSFDLETRSVARDEEGIIAQRCFGDFGAS